jgi:hypothetical protein
MLFALLVLVAVVWVLTAQDVLRRCGLSAGRRTAWILATLLLPVLAIPAYWATRPLPRKTPDAVRREESSPQTLADFIPEWTPESADACEQAEEWARDEHHEHPEPSFYVWLHESGFAERHPVCTARLVGTLLGSEYRASFAACPEVGALAALLEAHVGDADDVLAVKEQLRRLCPGTSRAPRRH